nr:hypothetical protein [Tanacetum cinerariifolium]
MQTVENIDGNQFRLNAVQNVENQDAAYLQKQMLIAQKEEAMIQLTSEEFDFMVAACAYGSVKLHLFENCYDNNTFNMFTQEEQYTKLLEPIPEPHQIERLQAQLGDLKGKSSDTQCASDTLDPLPRKLENENIELEFQNQRDLPRNTPLDRVQVLCMIEKRSKVRMEIMPTERELALEQSQQGVCYEVSEILFQPILDEYLNPPPCIDPQVLVVIASEPAVSTSTPSSTTINQDAPSTSTLQTHPETPSPVIPLDVEEADHDIEVAHMDNNPFIYKVKLDELGGVLKSKARLVVKADTLMVEKSKLDEDPQEKAFGSIGYRGMIGTHMYLTASRPNLDSGITLTAFTDADHAGCQDTKKSTSGSMQLLSDRLPTRSVVNADLFRTILDICSSVKGVNFTDVPDDDTTLAFLIKLGYKAPVYKHTNMFVDHLHPPWRTLAAIINKCLSGKKASNDKLQEIKQSESYQMFIKYSTGQISPKKSREAEAARQVHATHARIVIESVPQPTKRRKSGKVTSDPPKKLKGAPSLTPEEQEAVDIMQALKESKKTSKRLPGTRGSIKGTGTIPGVLNESIVVSATSSKGTDKLDDKEKDDKEGDADDEDDETESDEDDIYKYKIRVHKDEDEEMLNVKVEDSDKGDKEVTDVAKADAKKTSDVKDDPKKTELPPKSSSLFVSLDVSEHKKMDLFVEALDALKRQLPSVVDNYLGFKVGDVFQKELKKHTSNLIQKYSLQNPANHRLYHALMESLIDDENAMDKGVDDTVQDHKRKHDDDEEDDDEEPPTRPNQGKALSKVSKTSNSALAKEPVEETIAKVVMDNAGHLIIVADYFFNNDLEYLKYFDPKRTYTTSITKTKAARYEIEGIKDMVLTLWSPTKVGYDKDALKGIKHWRKGHKLWHRSQLNKFSRHNVYSTKKFRLFVRSQEVLWLFVRSHKLFHLTNSDIIYFIVAFCTFTRSLVIKKRIKDLQLGVESYQKKLNITPPQQTIPKIEFKELYSPSNKRPRVIYEDLIKQKRVMRANELYKFSDETLKKV